MSSQRGLLGGPASPLRTLALTAVLALGVTACGGDSDDGSTDASPTADATTSASAEPTDEPTDEPADEPSDESSFGISDAPEPEDPCLADAPARGQASGVGFALTPPRGWRDVSDQLTAALTGGNLSGIAWADQAGLDDGFADNLNVIVTEDSGVDDIESVRDQFAAELRTAAENVRSRPDREVACETALYQTATTTQQGQDLVYDQLLLAREGTTYVVTFTHTADTAAAKRRATVAGVTRSWKWLTDE